MKFPFPAPRAFLLLLAVVALWVGGCASSESNISERPWNSPQPWETGGLPSSMNEGH
jgi:hypothetical protein